MRPTWQHAQNTAPKQSKWPLPGRTPVHAYIHIYIYTQYIIYNILYTIYYIYTIYIYIDTYIYTVYDTHTIIFIHWFRGGSCWWLTVVGFSYFFNKHANPTFRHAVSTLRHWAKTDKTKSTDIIMYFQSITHDKTNPFALDSFVHLETER